MEKRNEVVANIKQISEESFEIMKILEDKNVGKQLKQDKLANVQFLKENFNVCGHGVLNAVILRAVFFRASVDSMCQN